ncbi:MAG: signal peptidase II [Bacteroidota bacterium]
MKQSFAKYSLLFLVLVSGCGIDLQTKDWAADNLRYFQTKEVIPNWFDLRYAENTGVAFSFLQDADSAWRLPLIFGGVLLSASMVIYLFWQWRRQNFMILLPLALILSGAFGNFIDRVMNGYVVDFFHFHYSYEYNFPIFNVADVLVFSGVVLMLIQYYRGKLNWEDSDVSSSLQT